MLVVSSKFAPTTAVLPSADEIDTDQPKPSFDAASDARSICCSVHVEPERVNTYAAPWAEVGDVDSVYEPIIAVLPSEDKETEPPNTSSVAASLATSLACSVHVEPDFVNT